MHIIYVYGTLRPGNTQTVEVPGRLYSVSSWFPGLKLDEDCPHSVVCEKIEVDDQRLAQLDHYEGYYEDDPQSSLYIRQNYQDGWIYVYNRPLEGAPEIESGDWLAWKQLQEYAA